MERTEETDILIHPQKGRKESFIPEKGMLLVNPGEAKNAHCIARNNQAKSRFLFNSGLSIATDNSCFIAGPSIGAPMAVMTCEKLIALGAKSIILFGWCGAIARSISIGDILVPHSALSGEGTSGYYGGKTDIMPSKSLNGRVESLLEEAGLPFKEGCVWSTDAIYRESRSKLMRLRSEEGVAAVDMEFSALCSVAMFRKIEFSAVLVVSDELWGGVWKPGFSSHKFKQQSKDAMKLLIENISII